MIRACDVSAVIVTRGDVSLHRILNTLPYREVVVWNDLEHGSQGCYGRYLAVSRTKCPYVYFQDDDLIFTAHDRLMAAYQPGRMAVNMPSPWYEQCGYDKLGQALVGAGSVMDWELPFAALERYLRVYPEDDLFRDYCDVVVGMLTPHTRHDFGYDVLPHATNPGRIYTSPGAAERKEEMQRRCLELRGDRSLTLAS